MSKKQAIWFIIPIHEPNCIILQFYGRKIDAFYRFCLTVIPRNLIVVKVFSLLFLHVVVGK